jgi:hypothetical protein
MAHHGERGAARVAATGFGMHGLDVNQQGIVTQVAPPRTAGFAHDVLVASRHTDSQHPA